MAAKIQTVLWSVKDEEKNLLFIDDDILLKSSFDLWNGDIVELITFYLVNRTGGINYRICTVNHCADEKGSFTLIHIKKYKDLPSKQNISFPKSKIGLVKLGKNYKHRFIFKAYKQQKCPDENEINCDLQDTTPETKDGTIVEGI